MELSWVELSEKKVELNGIGLGWVELNGVGLGWVGLNGVGLSEVGFGWIE